MKIRSRLALILLIISVFSTLSAYPEILSANAGAIEYSKLTAANTRFGIKLFNEVANHNLDKNIFISPLSISFALSMVYNGTGGETRQTMAKSLEFQEMDTAELNNASTAMKSALASSDDKIKILVANSLWARKGINFKPEFIK